MTVSKGMVENLSGMSHVGHLLGTHRDSAYIHVCVSAAERVEEGRPQMSKVD